MNIFKFAMMLCVTSVMAQTNYLPGTVTTSNNQVIHGEINYQDWKKTPETIKLKNGSNETTYRAEDLLAFGVGKDKYISRKVIVDVTEQRLQKMDETTKPEFKEMHIFLNVLVEGNLNLYHFYDTRDHFFYGKDGEIKELIYRESFTKNNDKIFKLRQYIGQLNLLMNECENIRAKENLNYKRKDLIKIISEYNSCTSSETDNQDSYVKESKKVKNRFYGIGSYYFSTFKIDSDANQLENFDKESVSKFNVGVAYEIIVSKKLGKWSMFTELAYTQVSGELNNDVPSSLTTTYNPLNIDHSALDISLLFRYSFVKPEQKVVPFINIGLGRSQILSEDFYVTRNNTNNGSQSNVTLETISGYFNFTVGAGVRFDKFLAELRYMKSEKIINTNGSNSLSNIGIMVGYQLF